MNKNKQILIKKWLRYAMNYSLLNILWLTSNRYYLSLLGLTGGVFYLVHNVFFLN